MSTREIHEKLAQSWTFNEATMGKGWEDKYPNIASWQGSYSSFGSDSLWKISLQALSGSEFSGFHTTTYTLVEKEVSCSSVQDMYQNVDELIKEWNDEQGEKAILRYKKGWIGETNWETCYPYIATWIKQGKRHCISIVINSVTQKSYAKAWLYDKPSDTETVLFEQKMENMTEDEVLQMLNAGIESWIRQHEHA